MITAESKAKGISYGTVDEGEDNPFRHNKAPILLTSGRPLKVDCIDLIMKEVQTLPEEISIQLTGILEAHHKNLSG